MVSRVDLIIAGVLLAIGLIGGGVIGARLQSLFSKITDPTGLGAAVEGFQFPSIDIFGPPAPPVEGIPLTPAGGGGINPADQPTAPTPIDIALSEGATPLDIAEMIGFPSIDPNLFQPPVTEVIEGTAPSILIPPPIMPEPLPDPISPITGTGGPSFEGGTIFETPIANLTLSQIIDQFNVTASQAANILAEAQGFTPQEEAFLNQNPPDIGGFVSGGPPSVSSPIFAGLSLEEIAAQIGQPISNF